MLRIEQSEPVPGLIVLKLSGRIMLGNESAAIPDVVLRLLKQGKKIFICDLSGVTHIDSTGIGRFIASLNHVFREKGRLIMAGADGQVREGFKVTRLDTVFEFHPTVDEALKAVH
ncbi:MAG: STAS domain-containing protein [Bryobacteraceae bacterium]